MSSARSSTEAAPFGRIALVIVNHNSGECLERCLQAVAAQQLAPARVIVVDNASTDDSLAAARRRGASVEILAQERNLGFAAANNLAVAEAADCEWVALLNPDAFPEPGWLAVLAEAARARPDCASFASRLVRQGGTELDGTGDVYHVSGLAWRRHHGRPARTLDLDTEEVFAACAAAALYRREVFQAVGGFDEAYFCYFEDIDLGFRLRLAGHGCLYLPGAVCEHLGSATTGKGSDFSVYYGHRNLVWTFVKNMPGPLFWLYLPQHLLLNLATVAGFGWRGRARVVLRAKWAAVRGLAAAWRARRRIQGARRAGTGELRRQMARGWMQPYVNRHV